MREKESFRPNLELIRNRFGEQQWLKIKDVCAYTGLCRNTVAKRYPEIIARRGCTQVELARIIS